MAITPEQLAPMFEGLAVPGVLQKTVQGAAGGTTVNLGGPKGLPFRVIDFYLISRDTTGADCTLKNGDTAITEAIAKGTSNNGLSRATELDLSETRIKNGGELNLTISADAEVTACVVYVIDRGATR